MKILLAHGADVHNTNVRGEKPLHWAAQCRDPVKGRVISEMLKRAGAQ